MILELGNFDFVEFGLGSLVMIELLALRLEYFCISSQTTQLTLFNHLADSS
jgi:hypothetical protein